VRELDRRPLAADGQQRGAGRTVTAGTPTAVGEAFAEVLNGAGSTVDVVVEQPGEQRYFCQVHPFMRGEIAAV